MRLFTRPNLRLERMPAGSYDLFALFLSRGKETVKLAEWKGSWKDAPERALEYSLMVSAISGIKLTDNTYD